MPSAQTSRSGIAMGMAGTRSRYEANTILTNDKLASIEPVEEGMYCSPEIYSCHRSFCQSTVGGIPDDFGWCAAGTALLILAFVNSLVNMVSSCCPGYATFEPSSAGCDALCPHVPLISPYYRVVC